MLTPMIASVFTTSTIIVIASTHIILISGYAAGFMRARLTSSEIHYPPSLYPQYLPDLHSSSINEMQLKLGEEY
jgi:hypothetical protein